MRLNNADTQQFNATPAFIKSINDDKEASLVLNVGGIHSGKQICSAAYNQSIFDLWGTFNAPLVYTPGDNEWTNFHKTNTSPTTASTLTALPCTPPCSTSPCS